MSDEIFQDCIDYLHERLSQLPDIRKGNNDFIKIRDFGLSAFSVFFMQSASFLDHQKTLEKRAGKSNAHSLFRIEHIPSDNHIRNILDKVPPSEIFPVYDYILSRIHKSGELDKYRHLNNKLLMPFDGVQYFSSKKLYCDKCSMKNHKDGSTTYSHSMVTAILAHPKRKEVLPLSPEFVEPQDGNEKQDCELAAAKRWLSIHGVKYKSLGIIALGDDLYSHEPFCREVCEAGFDFIFVCKPDSHKSLYEDLDGLSKLDAIKKVEIKHDKETWKLRYINQVAIKDGEEALKVNWCEVTIYNKDGKKVYYNTFITNIEITDKNVFEVSEAGRVRWKTENELNNTLKNHGYYLEHNYGHRKNHLSSLLATMIMLSFLFHTLLFLMDKRYKAIRVCWSRKSFFNQLKTLLMYMYFATWKAFMEWMITAGEYKLDTG